MPVWWSRKTDRSKESSPKASSVKNEKVKKVKENENSKGKSFEEIRVSPRNSTSGIGAVFSGFDSASSLDSHPLPKPNLEPAQGHGSGAGSVSSVSSSGSSEERTPHHFASPRGRAVSPLLRSPGRGARNTPTSSSPLHARMGGVNLDSPNGKLEDGRSELHKLPLPPTSPSVLASPRSPGTCDGSSSNGSKWRKGKLLGRGTFGHVYLGFNSENGQMCAIKEVKVISDEQSSRESLKQLNQEITLLSRLSHANIVQYYGSELNEERLSVYLEYVSGGSIHKLLQEYGAFGEPVVQNYTRQILCGLAYLHGLNTVHRDIKGANILVDPNGEIKLADFGMAKHTATCATMLSFKGSPYWMAPEVVMNSSGYSLAVDIWSLGCTVIEMASSRPPWSQYEGVAAIFKIGNSKDIPEIPDHLSADAKSFIRLCLQRDPSARPSASQLLGHPFVRTQTSVRATNVHLTRDAFPRSFDGSRTPTALEMRSSRANSSPLDDASRLTLPRTSLSPRESARTMSSLPVSPTRQSTEANSFFLSPPHPSYTSSGQSSRNYSDHLVFPPGLNSRSTLDQRFEIPQFRAPSRSPSVAVLSVHDCLSGISDGSCVQGQGHFFKRNRDNQSMDGEELRQSIHGHPEELVQDSGSNLALSEAGRRSTTIHTIETVADGRRVN